MPHAARRDPLGEAVLGCARANESLGVRQISLIWLKAFAQFAGNWLVFDKFLGEIEESMQQEDAAVATTRHCGDGLGASRQGR